MMIGPPVGPIIVEEKDKEQGEDSVSVDRDSPSISVPSTKASPI